MIKQKFYTLVNILKENCEYNLLLGERSNGKSYAVKHHCINDYLQNNSKFIYLRRYTVETKNNMVEAYFNDVDVKKVTKGKYEVISVYRSSIYFGHYNEKNQLIRDVEIGMVMALSISTHYKSMSLLEYKNIIFEEFITTSVYLPNETSMLQQLVSTIARRNRIKVFLIGNTISRLCPYFNEWQLFNIPNQKQGTIEVYHMTTSQKNEDGTDVVVNIAVEICENSGNNSKMFFGTASHSIVNGSWESDEQPHIPYPFEECQLLYELAIKHHNMSYSCNVMKHESELFLYIYPITKKIKCTRVIQDGYDVSMFYTTKLIALTRGDKVVQTLIKMGKICYSDNLTGTEFTNNILPNIIK